MNTIKSISLLLFISFWAVSVNAQRYSTSPRENYQNDWSFGAGINLVDDSGKPIGGISDPDLYWNFSRPFYVSAEYYLNNKFSFMTMVSFNAYNEGKQIDEAILLPGEKADYFAIDLVAKYSLRDLLQTYKFDPYVSLGFGVASIGSFKALHYDNGVETLRDVEAKTNFNIVGGFGFNYWFSHTWGLNMNFAGKWNTSSSFKTNHKQYALGVLYFLN